ncbi:MAG TPA: TrkH family potassium uptake protein [Firmicutes bacterium]|nr:TrkH family potassium uptake protein [Bacillota bacterium]
MTEFSGPSFSDLDLTDPKPKSAYKPVRMVAGSFLAIILTGTLLLCLPISSRNMEVTPVLDALFTATSATCVTGLSVYDTYLYFSPFGQTVILLLIQLGGIGLITFTTFFTLAFRGKLGLRNMRLASESANFGNTTGIQGILSTVITVTFLCEAIGACFLAIRFVPAYGLHGVFISIFMAVSAYCNAGFDILGFLGASQSLIPFANDPLVILTIAFLIIFGGIGFIVFYDLLTSRRRGKKVHHLLLHSKIVLVTTGILLLLGTVCFLIFEYRNTLDGMGFFQKLMVSFFSSTTSRTAGFAAVDYGQVSDMTKFLTIILMFVGASPGSTGGGIKTATLVVVVMSVISVMRGYNDTIIFHKRVDKNTVYKAMALIFVSMFLLVIALGVLVLLEPDFHALDLLFEAVSAYSTTGLSSAGTPNLSDPSQAILIFLMYIGRVGPLSFVLALSASHGSHGRNTTLPEGKVMIG